MKVLSKCCGMLDCEKDKCPFLSLEILCRCARQEPYYTFEEIIKSQKETVENILKEIKELERNYKNENSKNSNKI